MEVVFGIDLGTTNSSIGYFDVNKQSVEVIKFNNDKFTPSVVYYPTKSEQDIICGVSATMMNKRTKNIICEAKRFIGRRVKPSEIENDKSLLNKISIEDGELFYEIEQDNQIKKLSPVEVSSQILLYLKQQAINSINNKNLSDSFKAVITVPANFSSEQRDATAAAAEIAGIEVIEFVNEPTAAAIAYDKSQTLINGGKYMVIDFGGGTFDVSIVTVSDKEFTVNATDGDTHLGGKDIDIAMMNYLLENNEQLEKYVIFQDKSIRNEAACTRSKKGLLHNCELAKILFSNEETSDVEVSLSSVIPEKDLEDVQQEVSMVIDSTTFIELCEPLFKRIQKTIERALDKKSIPKEEIKDVILVGGPTKLCCFKKMIKEFFGKQPLTTIDTMLAVCQGAAYRAFGTDKHYTDVVPISLGVCNLGVLFQKIIPSGTEIPVVKEKQLMTAIDGQKTLSIDIYEGEKDICPENLKLGNFEIQIDKPQPKKTPVNVRFIIDSSGLFTVEAKIEGLGIEKTLIVEDKKRKRTKEMIQSLKQQVQENEKRRKEVEHKNGLLMLLNGLKNDIEVDDQFVPDEWYDSMCHKKYSSIEEYQSVLKELSTRYRHLETVIAFMENERESWEKWMK
ncbi:heat shock 70 kDa protein, putative [Entamoeba dispar SAW760]|uniref:Heat shock 70 kDa protein, putative n=1 Tax=Entamoeba dispar (strain ATCC PRA-260 / SAW760) TaxID=370354 RepID=B0ERH1_ENTDS|nr:heat shock 70 kDa protein, putative [Entamoeba dispar SAW760]EDR22871.1 heat shock 70 kDa protein, putative [Entamoeba dispar SAW760]|eukprot:EDR22871.1 heat shock 70 kDa protein, putative [Entamoeba dispar SAW760]